MKRKQLSLWLALFACSALVLIACPSKKAFADVPGHLYCNGDICDIVDGNYYKTRYIVVEDVRLVICCGEITTEWDVGSKVKYNPN